MKDLSASKKPVSSGQKSKSSSSEVHVPKKERANARAARTEELRKKASSSLGLRMGDKKDAPRAQSQSHAGHGSFELNEEESVLMLQPTNADAIPEASLLSRGVHLFAVVFTFCWTLYCMIYLSMSEISFDPAGLGNFFASMFAPPALLWVAVSAFNRRRDVKNYSSALRKELQTLLFPSPEAGSVINQEMERLYKQAAEISSVSKAVMKSLQRARHGLRVEIRDFSGVSKKAEFHIDRLAEGLNAKTEQLIALTHELENRTAKIDETVKGGVESWESATFTVLERSNEMEMALVNGVDRLKARSGDIEGEFKAFLQESLDGVLETSEKIESRMDTAYARLKERADSVGVSLLERVDEVGKHFDTYAQDAGKSFLAHSDELMAKAKNIENILGQGADKIVAASQEADSKTRAVEKSLDLSFENLNETVNEVAERLQDLSGNFDGHVQSLAKAADHVSDEASRLGTMMSDQISGLEGVTARTVEAITRSVEEIKSHKLQLDESTQAVADQSMDIANVIRDSASHLDETVDQALDRAERVDHKLKAQTQSLRVLTDDLDMKAESLQAAVTGTVEKANGLEDRVVEAAQTLRTSLDHIDGAANMLDVSHDKIHQLNRLLTQQSEEMNLSSIAIGERVQAVGEALAQPIQQIQESIREADERHKLIDGALSRRVDDLREMTEKASSSAQHMQTTLREQAQDMSVLSGQISAHARRINEQMSIQKDTLGEQVRESMIQIEGISEMLEEQSSTLSHVTKTAHQDMANMRAELSTQCQEINALTTTAFEGLQDMGLDLDGKISVLKEKAEGATLAVTSVNEALRVTVDDLEPLYTRAIAYAEKAQDRFESFKVSFDDTTQSNLERMQQIGIVFDENLKSLKEKAEEASDVLMRSGDHLHERAQDIEVASKSAHERMVGMTSHLTGQAEDIHLVTDQAILKLEAIQDSINGQFHDLAASIGHSITQLQNAGEEFTKYAALVQSEAEKAASKFDIAGDKAMEKTGQLDAAAKETVENSRVMIASLQREMQNMLAKAQESMAGLKRAGQSVAMSTKDIDECMKDSIKTSKLYGKEMDARAASIVDVSVEAAKKINSISEALKGTMDDINKVAVHTAEQLDSSKEQFSGESERLLTVSMAALKSAKEAAASFTKQAESLFKASQDAAHFAEQMQSSSTRKQRDAFVSSAKFIIESLHSLSVDVTRSLEGDISEKTWKAFQKGDVSAFTRKLTELGDKMPLEKARMKFAKDNEFRTYVQRYVRQFEEMYDQAIANDHGSVLSTSLGSSEVGKLYGFLCQVAGRESRLSSETLKVA